MDSFFREDQTKKLIKKVFEFDITFENAALFSRAILSRRGFNNFEGCLKSRWQGPCYMDSFFMQFFCAKQPHRNKDHSSTMTCLYLRWTILEVELPSEQPLLVNYDNWPPKCGIEIKTWLQHPIWNVIVCTF